MAKRRIKMITHQGKYGYYPCDWDTYRKLKAINFAYSKALHGKKQWERWERKDPKNRVIRVKLKNSAGQVVGYQAPIPMSEPPICPVFCKKINFDKVVISDSLYDDYRRARYPKPIPEAVEHLKNNLETINWLYSQIS
jgi:hypothetical protein